MRVVASIVFLFSILCEPAIAQHQFLDPSFGNGGVVLTKCTIPMISGTVTSMLVQPDHKILIGGGVDNAGITRYKENGTLDSSFGVNGFFDVPSLTGINAVAIQPDGKIIAEGSAQSTSLDVDFVTMRLNANGTLDNTFGDHGVAMTRFSTSNDEGYAVALQPDGKIVIAGDAAATYLGVARLLADGTPDSSFGTNGLVTGNWCSSGKAISVMADGRIVTASNSFGFSLLATRLLSSGALDTTFNHTGYAKTLAGDSYDYCNAMQLQSDGKIILAGGGTFGAAGSDFALVRYNLDGSLDRTFGDTGVAHIDFKGDDDEAWAMCLTTDGRILVGGQVTIASNQDFGVVRLTGDGKADTTFGINGKISTDIEGYPDFALAIAIQQDGKVLLGGSSGKDVYPDVYTDLAIVRYLNGSVGVKEVVPQMEHVTLYPNPAANRVNVDKARNAHIVGISAHDVCGREILINYQKSSAEVFINAPDGLYFFSIEFDDKPAVVEKLLVRNGN